MKPYYDRGGVTIYNGDCLEVMPKLDVTFDAIIADLPYGTTACSWDEVIPFEPLWENYKRLIKGNGAVVLFGSQPFTSKLVMSNLEWFKYEWIWDKRSPTGFLNCKKMPMTQHNNILIFANGNINNYNPQFGKAGKPYGKGKNRLTESYGDFGEFVNFGVGYPKTILQFPRPNNLTEGYNFHPTQKPVALLSYLIRTYTNPGEIILDNTIGSGTTLVAAQNEGRKAIGIELSEDYCKIAVDRLKQPSFFSIPLQDKPKPVQTSLIDDN